MGVSLGRSQKKQICSENGKDEGNGSDEEKYMIECTINQMGQKQTIGENATFDYFPVEYIQLQNVTSPNIIYAALSN